jgi:hypothetical protein
LEYGVTFLYFSSPFNKALVLALIPSRLSLFLAISYIASLTNVLSLLVLYALIRLLLYSNGRYCHKSKLIPSSSIKLSSYHWSASSSERIGAFCTSVYEATLTVLVVLV